MREDNDPNRGADLVVNAIVAHYLHTDKLIWERVQYLALINVAAWAAMYVASNSHWLVLCIGAIAVMFTWLLAVTVLGAIENRDVNMPLLDKLLSDCLGSDVHERLKAHAAENKVLKGHLILFALPLAARKGVTRIKALSLFGLAFGTSILVDVSMVLAIWGGYIEADFFSQGGTASPKAAQPS